MGRKWVDHPGSALLFSFILRPHMAPAAAGLLPLLAGWAMADAAWELSGADVRCKWPNDLLVRERKVAGILSESRVVDGVLAFVVIGIGVNLEVPEEVADAGGLGRVDRGALLTAFLRRFRAAYLPDAPGFADAVRARWRDRSDTLGRDVEVTRVDGSRIRGRALDVDGDGALLVETSDGPLWISAGDVGLVGPG
jgi:BirA family biotin operon repressor/biotin-[acetyl-CoA-carboxylase] ligase